MTEFDATPPGRISQRIREFRAHRQITQKELAAVLNIEQATVSAYETDKNKPGADVIHRMKEKFPDLNMEWLVSGKGQPRLDAEVPQVADKPTKKKKGGLPGDMQATENAIAAMSENKQVRNLRLSRSQKRQEEEFRHEIVRLQTENAALKKMVEMLTHDKENLTKVLMNMGSKMG